MGKALAASRVREVPGGREKADLSTGVDEVMKETSRTKRRRLLGPQKVNTLSPCGACFPVRNMEARTDNHWDH